LGRAAFDPVDGGAALPLHPELVKAQPAGASELRHDLMVEGDVRPRANPFGASLAFPAALVQAEETLQGGGCIRGREDQAVLAPQRLHLLASTPEVRGAPGAREDLLPGSVEVHLGADVAGLDPRYETLV